MTNKCTGGDSGRKSDVTVGLCVCSVVSVVALTFARHPQNVVSCQFVPSTFSFSVFFVKSCLERSDRAPTCLQFSENKMRLVAQLPVIFRAD